MTRCALTREKHSWIIEVINDLRIYCQKNELRISQESLDQCLVAALADLELEADAFTEETCLETTEDPDNEMFLYLSAGRHSLN